MRLREAATGVELIATKRELAELREEYNYMAAKLAETGGVAYLLL